MFKFFLYYLVKIYKYAPIEIQFHIDKNKGTTPIINGTNNDAHICK